MIAEYGLERGMEEVSRRMVEPISVSAIGVDAV